MLWVKVLLCLSYLKKRRYYALVEGYDEVPE